MEGKTSSLPVSPPYAGAAASPAAARASAVPVSERAVRRIVVLLGRDTARGLTGVPLCRSCPRTVEEKGSGARPLADGVSGMR
ncbi:hypothetical protein SY2F82_05160 [Streptomyces sp. Y2F8-2]|nr:hypothetical protein SY2F82_05160 [Streptomyces sp. Y2F8-2]